jgi:hypothetical protein
MVTVFKYKQKVFPKALVLVIFGLFPVIAQKNQLYLSIPYYLIFILAQAIIHVYYVSKNLIITDAGIEEKILWGVPFSTTKWEDMEEACAIENEGKTKKGSLQSMMEPFVVIRWFVENSIGIIVKIIVTNEEPLYLNLKTIKNSSDLYKILKEKIRFVRS